MANSFNLGDFAKFGRGGDDTIAHVATGERVIPRGILDSSLTKKINARMEAMGLDPERYIVGNENNSINPHTQQPEFGFLPSSGKKKYLRYLRDDYRERIDPLQYASTTYQGPFGTTTVGPGGISVDPSKDQLAVSGQFQTLGDSLLRHINRQGFKRDAAARRLMRGYEQDPRSRQDYETLYTAGLGDMDAMMAGRDESSSGSLLGRLGGGTASENILGARRRSDLLARQALRTGAVSAGNRQYEAGRQALAALLGQSDALRTSGQQRTLRDIAALQGLRSSQFAPLQLASSGVQPALGLAGALTGFDVGKAQSWYEAGLPYASAKAQGSPGMLATLAGAVAPAAGAYFGAGGGMPNFSNPFGGGGGSGMGLPV